MKRSYFVTRSVCVDHGTRILNYVIDYVASLVVGVLLIGILAFTSDNLLLFEKLENINKLEEYLLGICITVPYYFFTEVVFQRSLGKLISGTIVVDEEGRKPYEGEIIIRSL